MDQPSSTNRVPLLGPILTQGFAAAVAVWCAWYVTHIPWVHLSEQVRIPVLMVVWLGMCAWAGAAAPRAPALVGLGAGLVASIVGLLLLGSKLTEAPASGPAELKPGAGMIAAGFVALGAAIGLVGGGIGGLWHRPGRGVDWLGRFALVAAAAVMPLVFIGGLVTSTNSGMAVPDWPNTYGSNMFLYPLGPRVAPDVFFEHAHRLYAAAVVGLTSLVLMVWVLLAEPRRWVKWLAVCVFVLVCLQGGIGGLRVVLGSTNAAKDPRIWALLHGVLAQLTFGSIIAIAVYLSPTYKGSTPSGSHGPAVPGIRRTRVFITGALHSTLLQLVFGAIYRHFRDAHSLWSHAGLAMVVLVMSLLAGFAGGALPIESSEIGRAVRRCARLVIVVVILQFVLGWATFSLGGSELTATSPAQALLRTVHQANGALLLASVGAMFFWTRQLARLHRVSAPVA